MLNFGPIAVQFKACFSCDVVPHKQGSRTISGHTSSNFPWIISLSQTTHYRKSTQTGTRQIRQPLTQKLIVHSQTTGCHDRWSVSKVVPGAHTSNLPLSLSLLTPFSFKH